jgi:hypothetical protein
VYRGKLAFLRAVIKVIMHADAMYLQANPHRNYPSISQYSVDVQRPIRAGNSNDVENIVEENIDRNENKGEWDDVDTGNVFASFELDDVVEAWYDDKFYSATIVEVDYANELFTLLFLDDNEEINSYKACWMKHLQA